MSVAWTPPPGWTWTPPPGWQWTPPPGYNPNATNDNPSAPSSATSAQPVDPSTNASMQSDSYQDPNDSNDPNSPNSANPPANQVLPNNNGNEPASTNGVGNTYSVGQVQGNYTKIDPSQASSSPNAMTFTNNKPYPVTLTIWDKAGSGGSDSGSWDNVAVSEVLQPHETSSWAVAPNTQGAFAFTQNGENAWGSASPDQRAGYTWGEFNSGSSSAWGGADKSQIPGTKNDFSMSVNGTAADNAWESPSDSSVGKDIGLYPGTGMHITATV